MRDSLARIGRNGVAGATVLEDALDTMLGRSIGLTCAGRTDAGVHALAQVVHFDLAGDDSRTRRWLDLVAAEPDSLRSRLDRMVSDAITIWQVQLVPDDFDARFSAVRRQYRYRLTEAAVTDPRLRRLRWAVGGQLDLARMREGARELLGEHDFASFCRRAEGRSTTRRIDEITVRRTADEIHVRLAGKAFCHQQVRSIMGCLVEVGAGRQDPAWVGKVLAARDRSVAATVAPPHGLTLESVSYGRRFPASPPRSVRRLAAMGTATI